MSNSVAFKLETLVVLQYTSNSHLEVVDFGRELTGENFLMVDLQKGTWSYKLWKDKKIGDSRIFNGGYEDKRIGVIGVYDRTNTSHLSSMVHDAVEAVKERPSLLDVD